MRRISHTRPSPAILIAILALLAALAGTAAAEPGAGTSAVSKKKVKKIATKQINKLAPGLSVANAETATTANRATTANSADTSSTLDGLDSTAFARVVARDTRSIDPPNLGAGSCTTQPLVGGPFSAVRPGDVALVFPFEVSFLTPEGFRQDTPGRVSLALCNFTSFAVDQGSVPYRIMVLR